MADTALTVIERPEVTISARDLDMYRKHFCPDAPDNEWAIFQQKCYLLGLNPMLNEVYLVGRNSRVKDEQGRWHTEKKFATQVSITGLIALAERTQRYEGHTAPEYFDEQLNSYPVWPLSKGPYPYAIRIGVYKRGWREASYAIVYFHERAQYGKNYQTQEQELTAQWKTQGIHMHLKCTLAAALRWAFQETCGGVYIHEEMGTADVVSMLPDASITETANEVIREAATAVQQQQVVVKVVEEGKPIAGEEVVQSDTLRQMLAKAKQRAFELGMKKRHEWEVFRHEVTGKESDAELALPDVAKLNGALTKREQEQSVPVGK